MKTNSNNFNGLLMCLSNSKIIRNFIKSYTFVADNANRVWMNCLLLLKGLVIRLKS